MIRCHSERVRRSCGALVDAVAVGDVDMGLMFTPEGLYQPPQSGRQALEVKLHSELDDAWFMGRLDLPERIAGRIQGEVFEVGLVADVKAFKPELHSVTFGQFQVLE